MYSCSVVSDSATPWTAAHQASLSITISQKLLKLMSIESMMPSHPLLPPSAFCLSQHQSFSNESAVRTWWPKYWRFDFSISPSDEYCGLISFRIDWFNFLAVQGTDSQESSPMPQFKNINFLMLSFLYGPTVTSLHD